VEGNATEKWKAGMLAGESERKESVNNLLTVGIKAFLSIFACW